MFDLNTDSENKKIYSDTNLLKLENCFIYHQTDLQNVSFKIEGRIIYLIGKTGSGKQVYLKHCVTLN